MRASPLSAASAAYAVMSRLGFWTLFAPSLAAAAAFPWAIPEPTFAVPALDESSPAPTPAPGLGGLELFRRVAPDAICGYLSGISTSSLTCNNKGDSCATNTYFGAHGCCPSGSLSQCTIPTTCIPSSSMSASCTDDSCSKDGFIAKCTGTAAPECYQYLFVYSTGAKPQTLTEFGCAASPTTAVIERTYSGYVDPNASSTEAPVSTKTTTATATSAQTTGPTPLPATQSESKSNNTPAIIGGTIGGLIVLGVIVTLIIFLILRDRRQKREAAASAHTPAPATAPTHQSWADGQSGPVVGVTEYNPNGFSPTSPWAAETMKPWKPASPDCGIDGGFVDTRPGRNEATLFGVVESAGRQVHEAPG